MKRIILVPLMIAPLLLSLDAAAQQGPGPREGDKAGERRGPPPEAMEACKGKKDGDKASTKTPRGEMSGTCRLILVPDREPKR